MVDVLYYRSFWATWALLGAGVAAWFWQGESRKSREAAVASK